MTKILILPNPMKPAAMELTEKLIELLPDYGFSPILEPEIADRLNLPEYGMAAAQIWKVAELAMVLGGDGSMLNAARKIYPRQIPLVGINLGHLGYLTRVENNRLTEALCELQHGEFQLEERNMIEAYIDRENQSLTGLIGLNDLVVTKNTSARIIRLKTWIDDQYFTTYPADGLIVATATGSTAYSLSAGGPILDPRLSAFLVTPICAHSLYARPVVLSGVASFKVVLEANHPEMSLTADGQINFALQPGDVITFRLAPYTTKLVRFNRQGLFEVLRSRLKEGRI